MSSHSKTTVSDSQVTIPKDHVIRRIPRLAALVGLAFLGLSLVLGATLGDGHGAWGQFFHSYLVSFEFFLSISLGGMFFVLVHYLTKAGWGVVVRRIAENITAAIPLMVVLFIPIIAFGMPYLYGEWVNPAEGDHLVEHKAAYLNVGFFIGRFVFYGLVWTLISWYFRKKSIEQDESGDQAITRKLQSLSAPGMAAFAITMTFASFDWIMTLQPHWFSTMFGVYFFAGAVLSVLATILLVTIGLQRVGLLNGVVTAEHNQDVGKLLFAFVVFWAYIAFSQYMLIWYANIPEETYWYQMRWDGNWKLMSILLGVGHFAVPFFFLMSKHIKRNKRLVAIGAAWMLLMHFFDFYWLIMPAFFRHHGEAAFQLHILDLTTLIGIGGLFVATVAFLLCRAKLIPVKDPRLSESLAFENY